MQNSKEKEGKGVNQPQISSSTFREAQASYNYQQKTNRDQSKQSHNKIQNAQRSDSRTITFNRRQVKGIVKILWSLNENLRENVLELPQSKTLIIDEISKALAMMTPIVQYSQAIERPQSFMILSVEQYQSMKKQVQRLFYQYQKAKQQLQSLKSAAKPLVQKYEQLKSQLVAYKQFYKKNRYKCRGTVQLQHLKSFSFKYRSNQLRNDCLKLHILLSNNQNLRLQLSKSLSIQNLKQLIYKQFNDLQPCLMALERNKQALRESMLLEDIFEQDDGEITQRKAQIWQIQSLLSDKNQRDPISLWLGVAYLKCGHAFSRSTMRLTVDFQVSKMKKNYISCPYQSTKQNSICKQPIQDLLCKLIGGYTFAQWNQIGEQKSHNLLIKNSTKCPKCYQTLYIPENWKEDRFLCPICNLQICAKCCCQWKGSTLCQSELCEIQRMLLRNSQDIFSVKQGQSSNHFPIFKSCPHCNSLIHSPKICNLYTCAKCQKKYCFACLRLYCEKDGWTCDQSCTQRRWFQEQKIMHSKSQEKVSQWGYKGV